MYQVRNNMKIGFASDIHQLVPNRKLILAGVVIPAPFGELAHSDGAVVYHAVAEAILGALS
jgi:2-C-methyl-D-erythritol 2,4-cyclodiphosphate synthase